MSKRMIYLPALERRVTLGQYVTAVKLAKVNPDRDFKHGLTCWWPCTGSKICSQFREGVHERINNQIPYTQRGQTKNQKLANIMAARRGVK